MVVLNQRSTRYYTYTELSQDSSNKLYDLFVRGSGLGIEKCLSSSSNTVAGLLSLHHGDSRLCRGLPAGFWEVCRGLDSGIMAQLVNSELDGGEIVAAGRIATIQNPSDNRSSIYKLSSPCVKMALNTILIKTTAISDYWDFTNFSFPYVHPLYRSPSAHLRLFVSIRCLLATLQGLPARGFRWLFRRFTLSLDISWNVAITNQKSSRINRWQQLEKTDSCWHADPFISYVDGRSFLLTERFSLSTRSGVICSREVISNAQGLSFGSEHLVLSNSRHLSFPFTFERNGKSYMIPENSTNGCRIYELVLIGSPGHEHLQAVEVKLLLEGDWRDPVLVESGDTDYLFISSQCTNNASVLHVFMSSNILTEDLDEHVSSPCCIDHSLGRNAGRVFHVSEQDGGTRLIRPSQKNKGFYGGGIVLSELKLGRNSIHMAELSDLYGECLQKSDFSCAHHIESRGGFLALDYRSNP